jgi:hypothetical protein
MSTTFGGTTALSLLNGAASSGATIFEWRAVSARAIADATAIHVG